MMHSLNIVLYNPRQCICHFLLNFKAVMPTTMVIGLLMVFIFRFCIHLSGEEDNSNADKESSYSTIFINSIFNLTILGKLRSVIRLLI